MAQEASPKLVDELSGVKLEAAGDLPPELQESQVDDSDPLLANTENSLFDPARLASVSDGDKDFELELLDLWRENVLNKIPMLRNALLLPDNKNAVLWAHDIKGSSANVGSTGVEQMGKKLEDLSKASKYTEALAMLPKLRRVFDVTSRFIDKSYGRA